MHAGAFNRVDVHAPAGAVKIAVAARGDPGDAPPSTLLTIASRVSWPLRA